MALIAAGCSASEPTADDSIEPLGVSSCVVYLHGRSDSGAPASVDEGRGLISPNGNVRFGDGFVWQYGTGDEYEEARTIVAGAIDDSGCESIAVSGFSNGAAFAAKLYCRGETFDGRAAGFVIDDPVPDTAVEDCDPERSIPVALYWTGALASDAVPGAECDGLGWTCNGERLLGIKAYANELGTEILKSPYDDHRWQRDAPELDSWL